ncbi:hypothetical protein OFN46_22040 [Escherichia coli]|nr:hypothetical protein [Escherichia coli]
MKENKVQQISHKLINIVVFVAIVEYAGDAANLLI